MQIVFYPSNLAQIPCPARGPDKSAWRLRGLTIALTILSLFLALGSREAPAANRFSAEIVLGMSTVLTGNAGDLGKDMQRGILAGLERANVTAA